MRSASNRNQNLEATRHCVELLREAAYAIIAADRWWHYTVAGRRPGCALFFVSSAQPIMSIIITTTDIFIGPLSAKRKKRLTQN